MKSLSIYIHWPYCERKCPYCDFNSYKKENIDVEIWLEAYKSALKESFTHTGKRNIASIYFGGGTPSLMPPTLIEEVLKEIAELYFLSTDIEITLEANPTTFELSRFLAFKAAGINRLSIGVQSFNDKVLQFLGRLHTADEAKAILNFTHQHFERFSFDLIYALPKQMLNTWKAELSEAISLAKGHLSLYQLTIEPTTAFSRQKQISLSDNKAADMYLETLYMMEKAGMPAYEISNFSTKGQESRHNLNYWQAGDWIGIGPGAHGRFTQEKKRIATQDALYPKGWLKKVQKYGHARLSFKEVSLEKQKMEAIMTGLRTSLGFPSSLLSQRQKENLIALKEAKLLYEENNHIKATHQGWLLLNRLLAHIIHP